MREKGNCRVELYVEKNFFCPVLEIKIPRLEGEQKLEEYLLTDIFDHFISFLEKSGFEEEIYNGNYLINNNKKVYQIDITGTYISEDDGKMLIKSMCFYTMHTYDKEMESANESMAKARISYIKSHVKALYDDLDNGGYEYVAIGAKE